MTFCCISIIATQMGLMPQEIQNLGIKFTDANREAFFTLMTVAILYLGLSFMLYSFSDFINWYLTNVKPHYHLQYEEEKGLVRTAIEMNKTSETKSVHEMHDKLNKEIEQQVQIKMNKILICSLPLVLIRVVIDILFPIALAVYSTYKMIGNAKWS